MKNFFFAAVVVDEEKFMVLMMFERCFYPENSVIAVIFVNVGKFSEKKGKQKRQNCMKNAMDSIVT